MISGMRKPPPISTSWPRETTTSRPAEGGRRTMTVGGAVVDGGGRLGPGQGAEQVAALCGVAGPLVRLQVEFEVESSPGGGAPPPARPRRRAGEAEVGVQDHAGGVQHPPQRRPAPPAPVRARATRSTSPHGARPAARRGAPRSPRARRPPRSHAGRRCGPPTGRQPAASAARGASCAQRTRTRTVRRIPERQRVARARGAARHAAGGTSGRARSSVSDRRPGPSASATGSLDAQ